MQSKNHSIAKFILDELCKRENLRTYGELAEKLGVAPSTISTWIVRGKVNADLIYRVLKGLRHAWLLTGEGPMQEHRGESQILDEAAREVARRYTGAFPAGPNAIPGPPPPRLIPPEASNVAPAHSHHPSRQVPVISWVQAGDWQAVSDPYLPGYADEWVDTSATKSPNAFALVVSGDSMEPEFRDGDIITIDPDRQPVSGSYVVVKNGHEATFKQFVRDGASVFLKPLNDRYPIRDMTGIDFRVVGVVVEKRKRY